MLIKKTFLTVFTATLAFGAVENVEFLADNVDKNGQIIEAKGNVLLFSQTYLVTADEAKYDEANEIVELFGNVNILKGENETTRSNYAKVNLKTDEINADSSFAMDKSKELWIQSDESCSNNDAYEVSKSIVSSCNVQDPDWHIKFTSGELNKTSKFLHLYNPVFYVGDMPIFYLPYFGFSTDKTRRSGLLIPQISFGKGEGLRYLQPIYIATHDEWDLEFDPQVRTSRGAGLYSTFRFADSPYSKGLIRGGEFWDKSSYVQKEKLKNNKHYGYEIEYNRDKLVKYFLDGDYNEGLWLKYTHLNDIDYLNLRGKENDFDSLVQSKLNYFLTTNEHYFGMYAKYYIDTAKIGSEYGNDDTLQELPTLQYHSFLDQFILPNLTYSFDTQYHNYTRSVGVSASSYELNLPVGINFNILDDFANFSITENLYATHIQYDNNKIYSNGSLRDDEFDDFINHYHDFALQTDLAKAYDDFYHTMNLRLDYIKPGYSSGKIKQKLLKYYKIAYGTDISNLQDELFEDNFIGALSDEYTTENTFANLTQYFYDRDGKKVLRHSVKQGFNIENSEFSNLEHRVNLYLNNFTIANKFEYSHINNRFPKIQTGVGYLNSLFNTSLYHTYEEKDSENKTYERESYFGSSLNINVSRNYSLLGGFDYDFERNYTKRWKTGINYKRKCWSYSLIYQEDIEPKNTSGGIESKKTQGVYLMFGFYPFGEVGYDFSIEQNNNNGASLQ